MPNQLFYGDNLEVLRNEIKDNSIDLCYIDPPFNSRRNYEQIYNNLGKEDVSQAFIDIWKWDNLADQYLAEISANYQGKFTRQSMALISGLTEVLGKGSLLAYLLSMTLRIAEIHRILKPTGSFYLHCDPTASHYLKLVLDAIFCPQGGSFRNEIVWIYSRMAAKNQKQLSKCHDIIFWYSKSNQWIFNVDEIRLPYAETSKARAGYKKTNLGGGKPKSEICELNEIGKFPEDWLQIPFIRGKEYLGYPTQKPEALLERIIRASSQENDIILDAYCGCGTTLAVAQKLKRQWVGIDLNYQSISLTLKRLEDSFGKEVLALIELKGIPKDIDSAINLADKKDARTCKEFTKWAVLTYANNRATINTKKDQGVDGMVYFQGDKNETEKIIFQVKSGKIELNDLKYLEETMTLEAAAIAILITLNEPTKEMISTAKKAGIYQNKYMGKSCDKIQIVTIKEILEDKKRLDMVLSYEVLKSAAKPKKMGDNQLELEI